MIYTVLSDYEILRCQDEKDVFCLIHFGRHMQKHFFAQQIQDSVEIPVDRDQLKQK